MNNDPDMMFLTPSLAGREEEGGSERRYDPPQSSLHGAVILNSIQDQRSNLSNLSNQPVPTLRYNVNFLR